MGKRTDAVLLYSIVQRLRCSPSRELMMFSSSEAPFGPRGAVARLSLCSSISSILSIPFASYGPVQPYTRILQTKAQAASPSRAWSCVDIRKLFANCAKDLGILLDRKLVPAASVSHARFRVVLIWSYTDGRPAVARRAPVQPCVAIG